MRKSFFTLACIIAIIVFATACSSKESTRRISNTLDVNLSNGTILQNIDSHGWFGDAITYLEMTFSNAEAESIIKKIKLNEDWSTLPLTDTLKIAVYGSESPKLSNGPYLTFDDGKVIFPIIENGYYFFMDRHSNSSDIKDDTNLLSRSSHNFTIAIYDVDNNRLHYCESDT